MPALRRLAHHVNAEERVMSEMRVIRCPICGFSVTAPVNEPLPSEGPTCAMGHQETPMETAVIPEIGHG